jgi:hypothetical protein
MAYCFFPPPPDSYRIKAAGPFWRFTLWALGYLAITTPWRAIYILPEHMNSQWLVRHELAHIAQYNREGWIFWPRCAWYALVAPGYWNSPYEIEAREYEDERFSSGTAGRTPAATPGATGGERA